MDHRSAGRSARARWKFKRLGDGSGRPPGVFVLPDTTHADESPRLFHYLPRTPLLVHGERGVPVFSLTLVLQRQPHALEESIHHLIQQGLLNFDVSLVLPAEAMEGLQRDTAREYRPLFGNEVTFELFARGADTPLVRASASGTTARAAIGVTLPREATLELLEALDGRTSGIRLRTSVQYNDAAAPHEIVVEGPADAIHDHIRARMGRRTRVSREELKRIFVLVARAPRSPLRVSPRTAGASAAFDAFLRGAMLLLRQEPLQPGQSGLDALFSLRDRPPEGARVAYRQTFSGPQRRRVTIDAAIEKILGGALDGFPRDEFIRIVYHTPDGGLAPVTRIRSAGRGSRNPGDTDHPSRFLHARGAMRSMSLELRPNSRAPIGAHALIASDLVVARPVAVGAKGKQWFVDDIRVMPGGGTISGGDPEELDHLPVIGGSETLWPDRLTRNSFWYAPRLELVRPVGNEPPTASPFLFAHASGMGVNGEQTLDLTLTFTLRKSIPPEVTAELQRRGNPTANALPLNGLSVQLVLPFRDEASAPRTQPFAAGVTGAGDLITATVRLTGNWVRLCYGALAYPGFQHQAAQISTAYSFEAYHALGALPALLAVDHRTAMTPVLASRRPRSAPAAGPYFDASRFAYCFPGGELRFTREPPRAPNHESAHAVERRGGVATLAPTAIALHRPVVAAPIVRPAAPLMATPALTALANLRRRTGRRTVVRQDQQDFLLPCNQHGAFYVQKSGAATTSIGCRDAFKLGQTTYRQYEEIPDPTIVSPQYRVYRSLQQPGRFLVVPTRYVITRYAATEPKRAFRPIIFVYSTIDAAQPERTRILFDATLQPDIAPSVRRRLRGRLAALAQNPVIEFPTQLDAQVAYAWTVDSRISVTPSVTQTPDAFQVTLATDIPGTLLLRSMLETGGVHGSATFTLSDDTELRSELVLELASVGGPWETGPVEVSVADGAATLRNRIERTVTVAELLLFSDAADAGAAIPVGVDLAPDTTTSVPLQAAAAEIHPVSAVSAGDPPTLTEIRSFVEEIETNVIFIDLVNFANHDLKTFTLKARIKGLAGTRPVPLAAPSAGAEATGDTPPAGRVGEVGFTLPLTTFLDKHLLEFQVKKTFKSTGKSKSTPWIKWDLETRGNVISIDWEMIA